MNKKNSDCEDIDEHTHTIYGFKSERSMTFDIGNNWYYKVIFNEYGEQAKIYEVDIMGLIPVSGTIVIDNDCGSGVEYLRLIEDIDNYELNDCEAILIYQEHFKS